MLGSSLHRARRTACVALFGIIGIAYQAACAQTPGQDSLPDAPKPATSAAPFGTAGHDSEDDLSLVGTPRRLAQDEWHILVSPAHIGKRDLRWLIPLAGATAAAIATDSRTMRDVVSRDPQFNSANDTTSAVLRDAFIGVPILLFGAGELAKQQDSRDTGLLAGEAMVNAYVTSEAIKFVTLRERPAISNARGHFFASDAVSDPSFVSGHSIVAWSSAAVLASQYSRPWEQAGIYSAATAVSLTRVLAEQHFPSDVLLGAAAGWLIGHYVAHAHSFGSRHLRPSLTFARPAAATSIGTRAQTQILSK